MNEQLKKELAEFEALVDEIKGDCDKCKMDCRDRIRIMDHQIQRQDKALQRFEIMVEALASILAQSHPEAFQKEINILTAKILRTKVKGLHNDSETEIGTWD